MADSYISGLKRENRTNYATLHEINNRYFTEFAKGVFLLSEITPETINNYARFLKNKKDLGDASIGIMMRNIRTVINKAQKTGLVKYEINPFAFYSIKSAPEREVDITIDNLIKIKDSNPKEKHLKMARDLFMLSFYLGGINLIDLLSIDFREKENIRYTRTKSQNMKQGDKHIVIPIQNESREIIASWMNKKTGKLDFGYKFTYSNFSRYLTRCISKLVKELNINQRVIFYSARKTFAQFASELGIPDGVIDYCLGHSTKSRGIIRYYTKVREKQAKIAIERVIEYTNDPDKYKDYIEMRADIMMLKT